MKLQIMTEKALIFIKENIASLMIHYINNEDPQVWLRIKLGQPPFVEIDAIEFEEFELFMDEKDPSTYDIDNIKLFYTKLKSINDSFASDERLWAGLAHTHFYSYMQKRWDLKSLSEKAQQKSVINHYFFQPNRQRSYMINTLARLWWFGRKTYQSEKIENPFEILDYISHDINGYGFTMFGSNWSNNSRTLMLFFDGIIKYTSETGLKVKRVPFNNALKYINMLGGVYFLDSCDKEFIVDKIYKFVIDNQ